MVTRIVSGWKEIPTTPAGTAVPVVQDPSAIPWIVSVSGISVTNFNASGSVSNVVDNIKTTILTQAYVALTFENLAIVSVSGTDYAKFFLTLNGTDIDIRRTGPDRNLQFDFTGAPLALSPGDIIDIKVEHYYVGSLLDFDATIYGYN